MMKKGKKMATEWKKPIEKVKSPYSEKELLTMSFKEYWAQGFASARKEAEMKHQRKMDSILNSYICEMSEGMMSLSHVG